MAIALGVVTLAAVWLVFESRGQNKRAADPITVADQQLQKLFDEQEQHRRRQEKIIKQAEEQSRRLEALLVKQEDFIEKQLRAQARYDRILETWEAQQKQHQRYLDGLPKK